MTLVQRHLDSLRGLLLSSLLIVGSLSLVQYSGLTFSVTLHRVVQPARLDSGLWLFWACLALLVAWSAVALYMDRSVFGHLHLIGLLATPLVGWELAVGLSAVLAVVIGVIHWRRIGELAFWVLFFSCLIEILTLAHWLLVFFGVGSPLSGLALFELDIYYLLAVLAPIPLLVLLFGWVPRLLGKRLRFADDVGGSRKDFTHWDWVLFIFSIGLTIFAVYYPLSGGVNPHGLVLGYDFDEYLKAAQPVLADPFNSFSAYGGDRPVVFFVIYLVHMVSGLDLYSVLLILPFIFLLLLVVAAGFLGWEMFGRGDIASWCSFFTACGVFLVETVYGYFISNIIGLCLIFLWLALLLRSLRIGSRVLLGVSMVLGLLAFFSHPLTSEVYFGALVALWVLLYLRSLRLSGEMMRVAPIFLVLVLGFGFLALYLNGNHAILNPYYLLASSTGVLTSLDFLKGGYTSNLVLLFLAAFGLLRVKYKSLGSMYLGVLFAVSGLFFLFLSDVFRFRMLIALPLGLVAAFGFVEFLGEIKSISLRYVFTFLILLFFVVYLLRSLANLI